MSVIRYKNQSEYAFLIWMGSFPDSGHPLDEQRFYAFAKSVARYRSKRWLNYQYFASRVKKHTPHLDEEFTDRYWDKLVTLVEFHSVPPIPTVGVDNTGYKTLQRGVLNGKLYEVEISKEEYMRGGADKSTLKEADLFD